MRLLECFLNTVKLSWKMMMKLHLWQKKVASWSSVKPNSADLSNQVLHVLFSPQCGLVINPREPGDWIKSGHVTWCAKFDFLLHSSSNFEIRYWLSSLKGKSFFMSPDFCPALHFFKANLLDLFILCKTSLLTN